MNRLLLSTGLLCCAIVAKSQFTNSGNMTLFTGAHIAFYGDVTNNGTLVDSGLVVTMAGSNPQTISGSSVTTLKNLTINNTNVTGVTLSQHLAVRGVLTLTDGYVNTATTALLTLTNTASTTGASNASFVSGPMIKTGNQAFTFPVGKSAAYAPISISAPVLVTDQFMAEYFKTNPNPLYNITSKEVSLDHVSQCEYWMLNQVTGTASVTVTPTWDTRSCGVDYLPDLRVARWDGTQWKNEGNGGTTGTTAAGTVISFSALNTFGPFTLASISGSNILPIELTSFDATCEGSAIVLQWNTASEINNDHFTIERSNDGKNWETITTVKGAGNSSEQSDYEFTDRQPFSGETVYYRIGQTDYDGASEPLETISIANCRSKYEENALLVYPNPSGGKFNILYAGDVSEIQTISIFNLLGEQVNVDTESKKSVDLTGYPAGVYFVVINLGNNVITEKVTLQ